MKRLNGLFIKDNFRFSGQSRQKLGLQRDDIFKVWVKYGGPGSRRGILVRNSNTGQKIEVPADSEVIPEKGNRRGKGINTVKEGTEFLHRHRAEAKQQWRSPLSGILLAGIIFLIIYLVVFLMMVK